MAWDYNKKSKKQRNHLSAERAFEYEKLMRFLRNRYSYVYTDVQQAIDYENALSFDYMEQTLVQYGRVAVYKHPSYGLGVYRATRAYGLNIYGQPDAYFLYTANGTQMFDHVAADDDDLIILKDNYAGEPFRYIAERYGIKLGKLRETIDTNIFAMRTPFIVQAPKEKALEVKMIMQALNEEPEVFEDPNMEFAETIKIHDMKTPDRLKSLEDEYNTLIGKFLEEVGFSFKNIDKKERLTAEEASDDEGFLKAFDGEAYRNRLKFIKQMEQKFEIKLELVKSNQDLYTIDKPVVKDDNNDV